MVTDNLKELTQALTAVAVRGRIIELLSKIHQLVYCVTINCLKKLEVYRKSFVRPIIDYCR